METQENYKLKIKTEQQINHYLELINQSKKNSKLNEELINKIITELKTTKNSPQIILNIINKTISINPNFAELLLKSSQSLLSGFEVETMFLANKIEESKKYFSLSKETQEFYKLCLRKGKEAYYNNKKKQSL